LLHKPSGTFLFLTAPTARLIFCGILSNQLIFLPLC
jgi:hypothetical protein